MYVSYRLMFNKKKTIFYTLRLSNDRYLNVSILEVKT